MKRILLALAVAALSAAGASADPGGFAPPAPRGGPTPGGPGGYAMPANHNGPAAAPTTLMGVMSAPAERPPDRYGLLPGLRKMFTLNKGCSTCGECNGSHRGGCPNGGHGSYTGGPGYGGHGAPNPYAANQGTLVFPAPPVRPQPARLLHVRAGSLTSFEFRVPSFEFRNGVQL